MDNEDEIKLENMQYRKQLIASHGHSYDECISGKNRMWIKEKEDIVK